MIKRTIDRSKSKVTQETLADLQSRLEKLQQIDVNAVSIDQLAELIIFLCDSSAIASDVTLAAICEDCASQNWTKKRGEGGYYLGAGLFHSK